MDAPLPAPDALIRPWRTATLVASAVAAAELVLLLVAAVLLLAKPLSHAMRRQAEAAAFSATAKKKTTAKPVRYVRPVAMKAKLPRSKTSVWVLNGNGLNGAAGAAAARLKSRGYSIRGTGNAGRTDYATTVVMYRPGLRGEGLRLAQDMHLKAVGPLDGLGTRALHGAKLVVLLGAR